MVEFEKWIKRISAALKDEDDWRPTEEELREMNRRDRFSPPEPYFYRIIRVIIGIFIITALMSLAFPDMLTKPLITVPENGVFTYTSLVAPFILFASLLFISESIGGYALNKAAWVYDVIIDKFKPSEATINIVLVLAFIVIIFIFTIFLIHLIR